MEAIFSEPKLDRRRSKALWRSAEPGGFTGFKREVTRHSAQGCFMFSDNRRNEENNSSENVMTCLSVNIQLRNKK